MTILIGVWICLGLAVVLSIPMMVFGAQIGYRAGLWVGKTIRGLIGF